MIDKIKQYANTILGILAGIMTLAFLFERSKRNSADAILDNQKELDKLKPIEKEIVSNEGLLDAEEIKRAEIKKTADEAKHDDSDDPSDFLNKR